jgi:UDP-glucuronate decarboxylase
MASRDSITGPINIGNPAEFSILELATIILKMTNSRSRIVHRQLPQDDPQQRQPDITKARNLINWEPHTALEDGLAKTINYFEVLLRDQPIKDLLVENAHQAAQPNAAQ